ncbi:MAG TPA: hypothetical protein VFE80_06200 [Beijerinckiaceae bacterium]|nr:hypothetical protein [Beijerinckiaceae bacterium]
MTIKHRPRIGLRSALVALIVASVVPFGLLLHFTWWRTATNVSRALVDTLEMQISMSAGLADFANASEKPKKVNLNRAAELVPETWLCRNRSVPRVKQPLTAACRLHPGQAQLEPNLTERR